MSSSVQFKNQLPSPKSLGEPSLLIYDQYFDQMSSSEISRWIAQFPHRLAFASGEDLKDLKKFPERMEKILSHLSKIATKNVRIIGLGGGSLGDFTGFVASVLKRGLPLVHVPTTWLSAMDSSHGGKTALNVGGFKNQIGTFYSADCTILLKPILFHQPPTRSQEAFGEAMKMALLMGGELWDKFSKVDKFDNRVAWKFLPSLIEGKYKIVQKDPLEKKGIRHLLNLGHTLGHVWEASQKLPHGEAVAFGIRAALEFSVREKIMSLSEYGRLTTAPAVQLLPSFDELRALSRRTNDIRPYLLNDKKISKKNSLRFIFIQRPGKCPIYDVDVEKIIGFYNKLQE